MNGASGGFGDNNHQVDNTDMQDSSAPEQPQPVQPAQPSSIFNFAASQPAPSTNTNGFNFGRSTTQQSNGGFGGGLLGQQNTQNQNPNTGLFGQAPNSQQNGFSPSFGQNKQDTTPSIFNQSATTNAPSFTGFGSNTSSAPASAPTFSFGQPSASPAAQMQANDSTAKPNKLFDFGSPQSDSTSAPKKPSFSFGQPAAPPNQSESQSTPKPVFAGFGQPANSQQAAVASSPSLFSGFGTSSKSTETSAPQQSSSLFPTSASSDEYKETAEKSDSSEAQEGPKNPFSSLFAASSAKTDASDQGAKPVKTPFQFGQSTSFAPAASSSAQSSSIFAKSTDPSPNRSSSSDLPKDTTSDLSRAPSASFSPNPSASTSTFPSGLFNLNRPTTSSQENTASDPHQATNTPSKPPFSFTPQKPAENSATLATDLFTFGTKPTTSAASKENTNMSTDDATPPKKRLFQGGSTPDTMAQSALSPFTGSAQSSITPGSNEQAHPQPKTSARDLISQENSGRAVSTEGPPQIPRFLSGEKYKGYDESWRLKALNRRFKDNIAGVNTETHDFMNIVQNYLDHREAIGEGLAGYERKKLAGSKRKAIDVDDLQDESASNKRTRPVESSASAEQSATATFGPPKPAAPSTSNMFSAGATLKPVAPSTSNVFSASAATKPAATFTPAKTVADTQTSNIFKSMIPGAASSATPASGGPVFAPTKSTTPPSSPPKAAAAQLPKFEVPKFGGAGGSFMNAFAKSSAANAKKFEQEAKEKRKAEEFDSDEDDEEAWNKKYEEEQRAKKAKIDAAAKSSLAVPAFIPSASSSRSNSPFTWGQPIKSIETNGSKSPELSSQLGAGSSQSNAIEVESGEDTSGQESGNSGDDEAEHVEDDEQQEDNEQEEDDDDEDDEAEDIPDIPPEDSLFSRITGKTPSNKADQPILQPAANNSFKPGLMFGNIGKGTPEQPTFSPFTPASNTMPKGDFVPTTKFNFTPAAVTSGSVFGSSMLGGSLKEGPIPGEGLFGSRPSTPSNLDANKPFSGFGTTSTPKQPADNTYKQGTPIKFGSNANDSSAPAVEVTAATPPARETPKPFAGLFGQSSTNTSSTNGASLGFNFGTPSGGSQPAPGFLSAASHLGGTSAPSSRATSPGITSEAESVATDNTEDYSQEPQTSLMSANSGEENEDILYESKAIISRMYRESEIPEKSKVQKGWNKMGTGVIKLLKDRTSGKTRILFRAEPGANIILNTRLISGGSYKSQPAGKNGAVTFPVATDGGMQSWMIRVKSLDSAEQAAKAMEANKKN